VLQHLLVGCMLKKFQGFFGEYKKILFAYNGILTLTIIIYFLQEHLLKIESLLMDPPPPLVTPDIIMSP
jgi:hypothetical protein